MTPVFSHASNLPICSSVKSSLIAQAGSCTVYSSGKGMGFHDAAGDDDGAHFLEPPMLLSGGNGLVAASVNMPPSNPLAFACASTRSTMASRWARE